MFHRPPTDKTQQNTENPSQHKCRLNLLPASIIPVILLLCASALLALLTLQHSAVFKDAETLWCNTLQKNPNAWIAHGNLGNILLSKGKPNEAIDHFRQAIQLNPYYTEAYNNLAWTLATHPDPNVRHPEEAIRLVKHAYDLHKRPNVYILDTLAAAQAAAGRFDLALEIANTAFALAVANENEKLAARIRSRIELYKQSKPYRQPPQFNDGASHPPQD
jgi:tetratricopeptide (TPR) repeat protein